MFENNTHKYPILSIVAPAYNEEAVLDEFYNQITKVMANLKLRLELIYINDGSQDNTLTIMHQQHEHDERITVIDLSRNFGKEVALTAGLDYASGDAVVIIDVDLQDPPELIVTLVKYWLEGFDVVFAKRTKRLGESWFKRFTSYLFHRFMVHLSEVPIPCDTGDFRLMNRPALDALLKLREHNRYMKGLYAWVGFSQKEITYERIPRYAGKTKWNYFALLNLAFNGLTSFTVAPLRMASYIGVLSAIMALSFGLYIAGKKIFFGDPVQGYPSLVVIITFLGGIQLMALGIIGEYLGRVFSETKNRPLYIVKDLQSSIYSSLQTAPEDSNSR